jgi:asparagine synthetase B (glutamine-hydrolysing)
LESLRTFTWGTEAALDNPDTDAVRARELADACGVPHRYYTLPEAPEEIEEVFDRFVTAGEGRIDHISGYLDGFSVFENLSDSGVDGLIRGDEGFGWLPVGSAAAVRDVIGAERINDHETLPTLSIPGVDDQGFPARLARRDNESLATWRDRLYHTYRIPVVLGALTGLKTPYVEVVNPFLARRLLETVRGLPDEHRTDKRMYAAYVKS